jgi:hypothetical protein
MRCRQCNALLELREVPPVAAREGELGVEIFGLRCATCGDPSHSPEPPHPDFAADLLSAATAGRVLPTAARKGLLRRRLLCCRCGGDVEGVPARPGEIRARVRLGGAAPFTLSVAGPAIECPSCGQRQLEAGGIHEAQLGEALLRALATAGLPVR